MKKSLFIAALATLALASCSKNEVIELQQDQIKFSAVADNASRGTVVKTNDLNTAGTEIGVWGFLKSDDGGRIFLSGQFGLDRSVITVIVVVGFF